MSLLNLLTKKNLKLNKRRTIVTIIGITLSVALIMAVSTMYNSMIASLIKYEKREVGNFHAEFKNVPSNEVNNIKNNRKVSEIFVIENVGYAKIGSLNESKPYASVKKFTKESLKNLSVNLIEGRMPKSDSEVLIPSHLKTNGRVDYKIGDTITLDIGDRVNNEGINLGEYDSYSEDEVLTNINSKTYKVVGIIERPSKKVEPYSEPGYSFITYMDNTTSNVDVYAKYTKEGSRDAFALTANIVGIDPVKFKKFVKGEAKSEEEFDELQREYSKAKYDLEFNNYLIELETNPLSTSGIGEVGTLVVIISLIILVTSVFCIKNSFDISITEKIKQYGMLRSIGATKKQIKQNVFYEGLILGIIAIPLGIMLGILASYILIIISNLLLKDMLTNSLNLVFATSIYPFIVSILLGIITIYLSALKSAIRASKVSPIDSIRNSANIKLKAKKLKTPKYINKIFGIGGEISYKNLKRNKRKYRTTVISIIVSVSVFIALSSFMNLAFKEVDSQLKRGDYNIVLSMDNIDKYQNKINEITKFEYVNDYSIISDAGFKLLDTKYSKAFKGENNDESPYLDFYSIGDYQYKKYLKSLGLSYAEAKDKIILNDYATLVHDDNKKERVRHYEYKENDTLKFDRGENDFIELNVIKVTDKNPLGVSSMNDNAKVIVSNELFNKISNRNYIKMYINSSNPDKLQDNIDWYLKGLEYDLENINENVRQMNNLFTLVAIFLYGFIIVIILIGITNIYNTITTSMQLRKPEFASLKSLGMTKGEFNRMIRLESLFIGLKSLIFSISIGLILSYLIYSVMGKNEGLTYDLPIPAIIISIIAVFILINTLMRYSIKKINKQNIIETIRDENI